MYPKQRVVFSLLVLFSLHLIALIQHLRHFQIELRFVLPQRCDLDLPGKMHLTQKKLKKKT